MDEEVGKYRKKTESNVSKSNRKAFHKHQYEPCLLEEYEGGHFPNRLFKGSYCTICGKIENVWFMDEPENHNNHPVFTVKSIFQKYVSLGEKK